MIERNKEKKDKKWRKKKVRKKREKNRESLVLLKAIFQSAIQIDQKPIKRKKERSQQTFCSGLFLTYNAGS